MSGVPTMASEAPADAPSLPAAEARAIEHEAPLHSCPGCGSPTAANDVCEDCAKVPCGLVGCINCGDEAPKGVCNICDPAPLLAEIADARVSPEVIRAAVTAEREECAAALERSASMLSAFGRSDAAEALRAMALALRNRDRVRFG